MPARKLAMRATFKPLFGFGHRAAENHVINFGRRHARGALQHLGHADRRKLIGPRGSRSDPDGALPTGVRTAETMTASAIVVLQEIFDGIADFSDFAVEQMVRAVDHDKLFRLGQLRVKFSDFFHRDELVELAVNEECGACRGDDRRKIIVGSPAAQCR